MASLPAVMLTPPAALICVPWATKSLPALMLKLPPMFMVPPVSVRLKLVITMNFIAN